METLDLFADTLNDIANGPRVGGNYGAVTETLMRRLAEKGQPLAQTGR